MGIYTLNVLNCVYTPVKLYSSTEDVCPGGTVVFTCVTDTGKLIWNVGNGISQSFHSPAQLNTPIHDDIFTLLLQNVTGDTAVSIRWTGPLDWTTGLDYWTDL